MKTKLIKSDSRDIIIFLTGWGSDDNQYKNIKCDENLLICWDYSDLSFNFDFSEYKNIYLIAYSAGVYISGLIKDKLPKIKYSIAINGNPKIFDNYFGINKKALTEMQNLNMENYIDFRRNYLVFDEKELANFNKISSKRTFKSCSEELKALKKYYKNIKTEFNFNISLISDSDKIFNPKRQMEYFKTHTILKNSAHNIFCRYNNFSGLIKLTHH